MSDASTPETRLREALPTGTLRPDRILEPMRFALRLAGLVILALLILTPAAQVFMRQVLQRPMIGAEELSRFMLISVVMLAVPYTISSGASVRMEEFLHALPDRLQRLANVSIAVLGLFAFGFAALSVMTATVKNLNNATPTLGIPYYIFFSAAFVGFLLAAVEFALIAWKAFNRMPLYVTFEAEQSHDELKL